MIDDSFLRQVAALQANLSMLESRSDELSDLADMKELRLYKAHLADYIEAHASAGRLPRDPFQAIEQRLRTVSEFFTAADKDYQRLSGWKADWLKSVPAASLADLLSARAKLDELVTKGQQIQTRLAQNVSPLDWGYSLDLHAELLACAQCVSGLKLPPEAESRRSLYQFTRGEGAYAKKTTAHFNAMGLRIEELIAVHAGHVKALADTDHHLSNDDFRSAEKSFQRLGKDRFADVDYTRVESRLAKVLGVFAQFTSLDSLLDQRLAKNEYKAVTAELDQLHRLVEKPDSELGQESLAIILQMESRFSAAQNARKNRRITISLISMAMMAAFAALCLYLLNVAKKIEQARVEEIAKLEREVTVAKAKAEREAAEAKANAEKEAAEAKVKAERDAAEAKTEREAAEAKDQAEREAAEAKADSSTTDDKSRGDGNEERTDKNPNKGAVASGWNVMKIKGVDFLDMGSVKRFYSFTKVAQEGDRYALENAKVLAEFRIGSDLCLLNGVKFRLFHKVLSQDNRVLLSSADLGMIIDPILRPNFIKGLQDFQTVILDPLGGGRNKGDRGQHGMEAEYALASAHRCESLLRARGYSVMQTRKNSQGVSRDDRLKIINGVKLPAVMISIGFAYGAKEERGIRTFVCEKPEIENFRPSIALAATIQGSALLRLQNQTFDCGVLRMRDSFMSQIKHPAVLFEGGFLSHPDDSQLIRSEDYQNTLATAIVEAIEKYRFAVAGRAKLEYIENLRKLREEQYLAKPPGK